MPAKSIGLLLCLVLTARAVTYSGDQTFRSPFSSEDAVIVNGNLTLENGGTYSAASWKVSGNLIVAQRGGLYSFGAHQAGIEIGGRVLGPSSGEASLFASYRTSATFVGVVASNVNLVATLFTLPPPSSGGRVVNPDIQPPPNLLYRAPEIGANQAAPLVNISTRATLAPGQMVTPGFVVGGMTPRRVLIRAIGPTLQDFGVAEPMAAPQLTVYSGSSVLATNSAWGGDSLFGALFSYVGAFPLRATTRDAAVVLRLDPGNYTVQVRGTTGGGEVLVEVYFVD